MNTKQSFLINWTRSVWTSNSRESPAQHDSNRFTEKFKNFFLHKNRTPKRENFVSTFFSSRTAVSAEIPLVWGQRKIPRKLQVQDKSGHEQNFLTKLAVRWIERRIVLIQFNSDSVAGSDELNIESFRHLLSGPFLTILTDSFEKEIDEELVMAFGPESSEKTFSWSWRTRVSKKRGKNE